MRFFKSKIGLLAMSAVLLASLVGCSQKEESGTADTGESNEFRVAMECAYPPFNWTQTDDSNGAVKIDSVSWAGGYDVEIAKAIAEGLGKELVIVKTEWDGLAPSITSGKTDAIIAGMSNTEERRQTIDFTDNYYTSDIVIVVRRDSEYADAKTVDDFGGAKITAQLNTLHYNFLDQLTGVDKQTAMEDFPTMTLAVSSGKIDGYVTERPGAASAILSNPELMYVVLDEENSFEIEEVDDVSIAIGIAKDSPYKEQINEILSGIGEETRQQIMDDALENQPMNQE